MNLVSIPAELPVSMESACSVSLECWRLTRIAELLADTTEGTGIRRAVRRISATLDLLGIEVVDFAGRTYDSGMVPEVVEVRGDEGMPCGLAVVDETIAPTITWRGQVIRTGQVILRRGPERKREAAEVTE